MIASRADEHADDVPIHPDRSCEISTDVIDDDASLVVDSFTLSGYVSHWFKSRFAGPLLDAVRSRPSVMASEAIVRSCASRQACMRDRDGGIVSVVSILETAARYDLPDLRRALEQQLVGGELRVDAAPQGRRIRSTCSEHPLRPLLPRSSGCHGEHVESPDEFAPALRRALRVG